jgi:hypothetical protein
MLGSQVHVLIILFNKCVDVLLLFPVHSKWNMCLRR